MSVLLGHRSIQAGTQVTMVWDALDMYVEHSLQVWVYDHEEETPCLYRYVTELLNTFPTFLLLIPNPVFTSFKISRLLFPDFIRLFI